MIYSTRNEGFYFVPTVEMLTIETPLRISFPVEISYLSIYLSDLLYSCYIILYYSVVTCVNSTRNNGGLSS